VEDTDSYYTGYGIPDDDTILWRYMDLAKFISLLKDKTLYMTRADMFEDPFEGAVGLLRNQKEYDDSFYRKNWLLTVRKSENACKYGHL
jgi:hypothetical protein